MKILQICNKSPYPVKEGGPIAMNALTESLLQLGHQVKILAVNTPKYHVDKENVDTGYLQRTQIEWVDIDTNFSVKGALACLLKNQSYHVKRFYSKTFEKKLIEILRQQFDIVILETVYMAVYYDIIRKNSSAKIVLRSHNVEHKIWQRVGENTKNPVKRCYIHILARQLKNFEQKMAQKCNAVWTISQYDRQFFASFAPVEVLPFATNLPAKVEGLKEKKNLFMLGSMDWQPNIEGTLWFVYEIFPLICTQFPNIQLKIAGRKIPHQWYNIKHPNIEIVGEVPSAKQFMQENGALVVPLLSGSGIRIKIVEALSLGKTVITTTIGKEGLDVCSGKHLFIADNAKQFAQAVKTYFEDEALCGQMSANAVEYIQENHSYSVINKRLEQLLANL